MGPLVSIITVSYNSLVGLIATNRSLPSDDGGCFETIVVDSLSADGTSEFLQSPECRYAKVIQEKDSGIYDAMNKGIGMATGQYLLFLNCGDRLAADLPWDRLLDALRGEIAIHIGNLRTDDGGNPQTSADSFSLESLFSGSLPHQAAFIPASCFQQIGPYDTAYAISADQEWFLRALKRGLPFRALGYTVADYAGGGISERPENTPQLILERRRMLKAHLTWWEYLGIALLKRFQVTRDGVRELVKRILRYEK